MVSVLAFYSDGLSLNPADYKNIFLCKKTKIKGKKVGLGPSLKNKQKTWSVINAKLVVYN